MMRLAAILFMFTVVSAQAVTRNAFSTAFVDVNNALNGVGTPTGGEDFTIPLGDDDVLNVPAGTSDWGANQLVTTKRVKIVGAGMLLTDITTSYGYMGNPGTLRGAISFQPTTSSPNWTWGISGMTVRMASPTGYLIHLLGASTGSPSPVLGTSAGFRMHDMKLLNEAPSFAANGMMLSIHDIIGVIDHCYIDTKLDTNQWLQIFNFNWGGDENAHGTFRTPNKWGSIESLYFEDCYIPHGGGDAYEGGKYIVRHCRLPNNARPTDHGTEAHPHGARAREVYQNWFSETPSNICETRSGSIMIHDNIIQGTGVVGTMRMQNHRNSGNKNNGSVRGENPTYIKITGATEPTVDQNRPLANPAALPSSSNEPTNGNVATDEITGTASAAMVSGTRVFTDSTKLWATNVWKTLDLDGNGDNQDNAGFTYQLVNTNQPSMSCANIESNTATTLTVGILGLPGDISFAVGEAYAIRKVYAAQDQPGMGVIEMSDTDANIVGLAGRVSNENTTTGNTTIANVNNATGVRAIGWMNQKLDPAYNWNNWSGPLINQGTLLPIRPNGGQYLLNRDFFNRQKPAPGYTQETGTYGPLILETHAPGYPVISSPTVEQRRIGAADITGVSNTLTLHGSLITTVSGFTYPHPYTQAAAGKIIVITGDLAFGNQIIGDTPVVRTVNIENIGTATLTVSSVSGFTSAFTGDPDSFAVLPGASFNLDVTFTPSSAIDYTATITFNSDATSGINTILATGRGVNGISDRPYSVFQIINRVITKWLP